MDEMQFRKDFNYPPFSRMIEVMISAVEMSDAIKLSREFAIEIHNRASQFCDVIGPAPAVIPKMKNLHRWQFTIKLNPKSDPTGKETKKIIRKFIKPHTFIGKTKINVSVDVDPIL